MKTVNSISGGKTSSYLAVHYPADYNLFSLVLVEDRKLTPVDKKFVQIISDKIGKEFIGTVEKDQTLKCVLDLEQILGTEIKWLCGDSFEQIIKKASGYLPNVMARFCTSEMKAIPLFEYWRSLNIAAWEVRFGFRANEMRRAKKTNKKLNENGLLVQKGIIGKHDNGNNKWQEFEYQKPTYPLIEDVVFKDKIENFWKDKPVRFAWMNNCVGCMHKEPILLKKMMSLHPEKLQWFIDRENEAKVMRGNTWRQDVTYEDVSLWNPQHELHKDDFNECDSGYCGL